MEINIPDKKGTYALIFRLERNKSLTVGKLGRFLFRKGFYIYVGSAQGPGGLKGRINHHQNYCNKPHWHIDYLRTICNIEDIWVQRGQINHEHRWASFLKKSQTDQILIRGFGSSDCSCLTHLFYFPNILKKSRFQEFVETDVESVHFKKLAKREKSKR